MGWVASLERTGRELWSDGKGLILLAIAGGWGLSVGGRMIYSVLLPNIRGDYGMDLATAGLLLSVLFLAYAVGQLPGGLLADLIGERYTLVCSMFLSAFAVGLVVLSNSVVFMFGATVVFGLGIGTYTVARFTALSNVYADRFGTAAGLTNASAELGQALLPPLAAFVAAAVGWQLGLGFTVPLFLSLAVALWLLVPARSEDRSQAVETLSVDTGVYILRTLYSPPIATGTAVFVLGIAVWQAFTGFYPTYLVEVKGFSTTTAGVVFGVFFALSAVMHPVSGFIYDRWGIKQTMLPVAASVVGFFALPFVDGLALLLVVTVLLSVFLVIGTALEAYLVESVPADIEGTGFGILRTFVFGLSATSPLLFGWFADLTSFDVVFRVLGGLLLLMMVVGFWLPVTD